MKQRRIEFILSFLLITRAMSNACVCVDESVRKGVSSVYRQFCLLNHPCNTSVISNRQSWPPNRESVRPNLNLAMNREKEGTRSWFVLKYLLKMTSCTIVDFNSVWLFMKNSRLSILDAEPNKFICVKWAMRRSRSDLSFLFINSWSNWGVSRIPVVCQHLMISSGPISSQISIAISQQSARFSTRDRSLVNIFLLPRIVSSLFMYCPLNFRTIPASIGWSTEVLLCGK